MPSRGDVGKQVLEAPGTHPIQRRLPESGDDNRYEDVGTP